MYGIIGSIVDYLLFLNVRLIVEHSSSGLSVVLYYLAKLIHDDLSYLLLIAENLLHLLDVLFQLIYFFHTAENILLIDIAELYLSNIFSLNLVYAEAYHKVWDNVRLILCLADDLYCLVNIKKYLREGFQQVKLLFLLLEIVVGPALDTLLTESSPLGKYLTDTHDLGSSCDQDIEVAWVAVLQRSQTIELLHELIRVCSAL